MQGIESDIFFLFLLLSLATLFCTFYKFIVPASPDLVDNLYLFYDLNYNHRRLLFHCTLHSFHEFIKSGYNFQQYNNY